MQIRALEVFVELAGAHSMRQAALRLNLAPTAIGRHIDQLEYHFRAKLIDRLPGGIVLTPAGRLLAERARGIINDAAAIRTLIDDLRELQRGVATIRAAGAVVSGLLAPALCDLRTRYPGLQFQVDVANAREVFTAVAEGHADLGITLFSPEPGSVGGQVAVCHSRIIPHVVVVNPGHALAGREAVSIRELAGTTLAIPDGSFGVRQSLDRMARAASLKLDPVFVTGALDLQKELAMRGMAALVLPELCCQREIASGLLLALPLAEGSRLQTALDICKAPDRTLSFAATAVLEALVARLAVVS
jgi:DNA-binding transcriptional LysR family regulator